MKTFLRFFLLIGVLLAQPFARATLFLNDTFTDTNGTNLASHTGEAGATWTQIFQANGGALKVQGNRVYDDAGAVGVYVASSSGTPASANYEVTGIFRWLTVIDTEIIVDGRSDGTGQNGYRVRIQNTQVKLLKVVSNTESNIGAGSASETWSAGVDHTFILRMNGTAISLLIDGTTVVSGTDSTYASAGNVVIISVNNVAGSSSTGVHLDSITGGPVTGAMSGGTTGGAATGTTTATITNTAASAGTAPYNYQFQRAPDVSGSPGSFSNVGSARTGVADTVAPTDLSDTGLTANTKYWYQCVVTDSASGTATTTPFSITTNARAAAHYFISSAGNDSNAGTSSGSPWLTIGKMNTTGFVPGDEVSLRGGDTFTGNLLVNPSTQPSATTRINVDSYGTGTANISCGDSYGVKIANCGYVTVSNIKTSGSGITVTGTYPNKNGTTTSTTAGVLVETTTTGTWYGGVVLDSIEATGSLFGIEFHSTDATATAAHENFRITNCNTHHDGVGGIWMQGTGTVPGSLHQHSGILFRYGYIADCQSTHNAGITNYDYGNGPPYVYWSGFGIFPLSNAYTVVDRCYVDFCGEASYNAGGGGPVGIIFVESNHCTIRNCEVAHEYATGNNDGNAYDADINATDIIIENCYAHDCEGSAVLTFNTLGLVTIRGCVFENNGRICNASALIIGTGSVVVYNNTFFHSKATSGPAPIVLATAGTVLYNNLFIATNGATFGSFVSGTSIVGNTYYAYSGSTFSLTYNGTTYTSLAAMQAASLEKIGARTFGASGDPVCSAVGAGTTVMPSAQVRTLANYDLGGGSSARGAGVDLLEASIIPPNTDWHGNAAISGESDTLSGVDSGAVRYGSTANTGTGGTRTSAF